VAFRVIRPNELEWTTRDHGPEEAPRHIAELSERAGFAHTRANVWRYEPSAKGRRHKHPLQEETFVVLAARRAPSPAEKRIHLMKLSEALCDYIHVRQIRFRTLVEEGEDRGGECSA
jgi:hypothetical protein